MKIVATNQAATNVDATQILQDRAARLQGEGARPRSTRLRSRSTSYRVDVGARRVKPGNYCFSVAKTRGVQYGHGHGHFLAIRLGFDPQNATSRGDFLWLLRGLN